VTRSRQWPWPCCFGGRKKKEKAVSEVYTFLNGRRRAEGALKVSAGQCYGSLLGRLEQPGLEGRGG
jgi:hypothetical protein